MTRDRTDNSTIDKEKLEDIRKEFSKGCRVMASMVGEVEPGETGVVVEVKDNGDILVFWDNGYINDVNYMADEIFRIHEKGCILGKNKEFSNGRCEGRQRCETCGWNFEIAEKRKMMIKIGKMKEDKRGVKRLVIDAL